MNDACVALARRLGYAFRDAALLERALTHRSKGANNNERLEFLGDSILSFVVADALYARFSSLAEGDLTRLRATLVRQETLAHLARTFELGGCLQLGSGELKSGGFDRDSILSDALEAIFGAVYLDGGLAPARDVILRLYRPLIDTIDPGAVLKDPKTRLQEWLQGQAKPTPVYQVVTVTGEAHQQNFVVECRVEGLAEAVRGEGSSRRGAEQEAAQRAYERLTQHA